MFSCLNFVDVFGEDGGDEDGPLEGMLICLEVISMNKCGMSQFSLSQIQHQ